MADNKLSSVVMTFLVLLIGLILTPTIQEQVTNVTGSGGYNLTGAALALANLIPVFWVIGIVAICIAQAVRQFRA